MSDRAASGFARALAALNEASVSYVVVGVTGINFYARTPAEAYATLDLDTLLEPHIENLKKALRALTDLGYEIESAGEPFLDTSDESTLQTVIRNGATLSAVHGSDGQVDLLLSISGSSWAEFASDATTFAVAGTEVRVGSLERLLRSKEASGRPKDRAFLQLFAARSVDDED